MSPLDAGFLDLEDADRHSSLAIASVAVFEGPAPSYDECLAAIAGRLPLITRYRQKVHRLPLDLGRPVWVDDPHFDLRYHLRQTALPAPGGDRQLCRLIERVMTQRLDRERPLWECWLVEGLDGGRWALLTKVHHCMVDGVSGADLYRLIFDATPSRPRRSRTIGSRAGAVDPVADRRRAPRAGAQPGPAGADPRRRPAPSRGPRRPDAHHRSRAGRAGRCPTAGRRVVAQRPGRAAAALSPGPGLAGRRQGGPPPARRDRQRRRAGRARRGVPGAAARPRRAAQPARRALAGAGVGPGTGRGHPREPRVAAAGLPTRRPRRPGGTAGGGARPAHGAEGEPGGGGRRGGHRDRPLRTLPAALPRPAASLPGPPAQHRHGHHQRARPARAPVRHGPPGAGDPRPDRHHPAAGRGRPQLLRPAGVRGHRRPRQQSRHRRAGGRHRGRPG